MKSDRVVLLHGLWGDEKTMSQLASRLRARGHRVHNLTYRSRKRTIEQVAKETLAPALEGPGRTHVVTHSLGGLVLRDHLARQRVEGLGRVVMLAPPNRGSRLLADLHRVPMLSPVLARVLGPTARQIASQAGAPSVPVEYELGVVAAKGHGNPLLRAYLGPHDGKLAVEETHLEGMRDFWTCDRTHGDLMNCPEVAARVASFLETGRFR